MKLTQLFPLIMLTTATFAYVDMDDRLDTLEREMKEVSAVNPQETRGAGFVTSRPDTVGNNWFITLDILYWHPKLGGTEYAISTNPDFITTQGGQQRFNFLQHEGAIKENDFSWDLGLKAGIGYKTPHDDWDVYARYTWFESNSSSSCFKTPPAAIFTLRSVEGTAAKWAKSHVDIEYNNIELQLARSFFLSRRLSIRPHFDLKTTWLSLAQNITYNRSDLPRVRPELVDLDRKIKDSSKMRGFGPQVGVDGKLYVGNGVSLFGDLSGSILYSYFRVRHKETHPVITDDDFVYGGTQYTIKDNHHRFIPFVQMFVGLTWDTYLNSNRQHLSLKGGYEVQYFWRINQMMKTESQVIVPFTEDQRALRHYFDPISEDLMFYGITGEVRLDF
ncbi:MAG: MOMP family protein [Simkaniaceae bacterium]|nr:MAG: MOMP family protein [Simkaniaceae bacterium]